jgi:hypothetical protein
MTVRVASWLAAAALACVYGVAAGAPRTQDASSAPAVAGGVPTRSPGKPTAPMTIEFALAGEPAVGALLAISIEVRASAEVGDLALDVRADDGVALLVAALAPAAGTPGAWTVTVVPLTDVTAYLNVTAQGTIGGAPQTRSVAIPVRVGNAKPARAIRASAVAEDREGERVILLPAVEAARPGPQ